MPSSGRPTIETLSNLHGHEPIDQDIADSSPDSDGYAEFCGFCVDVIHFMRTPQGEGVMEHRSSEVEKHPEMKCRFCEDFLEDLHRQLPEGHERLDLSTQYFDFTRVTTYTDQDNDANHNASSFTIGRQIESPFKTIRAKYALWVECEGQPKCSVISDRAPILGPGIEEFRNQIQFWLSKCDSEHLKCSNDQITPLPTRVLSLSGSSDIPTIRLVESKGLEGRYCALSHCWGPVDKRPARTTRATLAQNLVNIPLESLPPTFRDTVVLVYRLGIPYLWIDSLCILQDDLEDWKSEAKEMRNVYSNATIVIAASGAEDATQGLFVNNRPHALVHEFPLDSRDEVRGVIKVALLPWAGEHNPSLGALNRRAWALQERYLAQRLLAFMPGGISWTCNSMSVNELEHQDDLGFHETSSWHALLGSYTHLDITYHSDRLEALRGMVAKVQEDRKENFDFRFGVWQDTFHEDLLWLRAVRTSLTPALDLPTWSWAATEGGKEWCAEYYTSEPLRLPEQLRIQDSGIISAVGHVTNSSLTLQIVSEKFVRIFRQMHPAQEQPDSWFTQRYSSEDPGSNIFSITGGSAGRILMGMAVFDSQETVTHVRCFLVAATGLPVYVPTTESQNRPISKLQEDDKKQTFFDEEQFEKDVNVWQTTNDRHSYLIEELIGISVQDEDIVQQYEYMHDNTEFIYWCLLLEPISEGKYKRVGLAMLYAHAKQALGATLEQFELV